MLETKGLPIATDYLGDEVRFIRLCYESQGLDIEVSVEGSRAQVHFDSVVGFRMLDEGDLMEFWTECSLSNGWLFQISNGGWYRQEAKRSGFMASANLKLQEFLLVSRGECISVFCEQGEPKVCWLKD
ncbi:MULTISPECIES: hypothetical protein [Shewanella]|uniref:Uncharacterized protein n=1 Tax=Shewanella indica TaxID=768528 RepID=A0ABU4Q941_9GAMM|nr:MULTISPECIES: hypothetical protein [Shewanella]MDX6015598.1 hypothetical protein [Shewanella indica]NDO73658.1 hypothetical protein [Shewanella sp. SE1]OIN11165.1 hypothetical protein BFS86_14290 [Shewanella algae]